MELIKNLRTCAVFWGVCSILYAKEDVPNTLLKYKQEYLDVLASDPSKTSNPSYPYDRVLKTICADDTDYIPKVPDAGEIFEENGLHYQLMHNGIKVVAHGYYGSWMSDVIHGLKGHHEPQEEKAFYEVLKHIAPSSTMIELGAYWGYYSLWFSKTVPKSKNWLVEPELANLQLGMKNFSLNGAEGHFKLGFVQLHADDPVLFSHAEKIGIDTFMAENNIDHIHLLHSDIQGAEHEMLLSSEGAIKNRKIDYLFISTHSPGIHDACREFLLKHNYILLCEHGMHESCSVDGLIVARRKEISGPTCINIKRY